ncbi:MAG: ABC transporter substrate-binding protein [Labilithrix sp.]|nr:ABC transporter substrate-binding protein [Labilithrix sp.]MCW5832139.1 ABC transporter substrate-binding protein [Labilithrix sp.]
MRFRHFFRAVFFGLSVTTLSLAASADVAGAQSFVEREHGQIKKLVERNAPATEVTKAIDGMVDYDALAQRALGNPCPTTIPNCTNHWNELNDAQKKEVTALFKGLVEKKYRENAYKTRDFDVSYRGAKEQSADISKVRTEAKNKAKPREPAVQVDYIIKSSGNGHKVIDLVTEGSILTKNYYDQSHKMLTTPGQGYPYFVQKLRDKIAKK